ncbi:MAG TPA: apolipoprotein N-acyltransferase [Planctomycetaceae bacterium]|nr:apolipoprotein N-acyltransferase [Planctomycetaceae bacterium]
MSVESPDPTGSGSLRPEVQRIIAAGRSASVRREGRLRSVLLLGLLSATLLWAAFTPLELASAAWVSLVPLGLLGRPQSLPRRSYLVLWGCGLLWGLATLQWMRLGHPAMYVALLALAAWLGLTFPVFVGLVRRANAGGLPIWLSVPLVWTTLEYARGMLLTGFAWYYLGHSQYRWISLIQIADVTGAWGVSFLVALISGVLVLSIPPALLSRWGLDLVDCAPVGRRGFVIPAFTVLGMLTVCLVYGAVRSVDPASTDFPPGPVVALIQGNFTPELKHDPQLVMSRFRIHNVLMQSSVRLQPDLVVWPETMFPWPERSVLEGVTDEQILAQAPLDVLRDYGNESALLVEPFRNQEVQRSLAGHAQGLGAALVIGLEALVADETRTRVFNSAAFVRPDVGYVGRYDKIHRVVFGEYIPLKDLLPWLSELVPFGAGFGIDAGSEVRMFEYGGWQMSPLICFEDTVPGLVRRMAAQTDKAGRGCDLLVNLTNDAWFHGSSELDQHLITAAFRCVENRVPMVRAVNGGVSAFIDGDGRIRDPGLIQVLKEPLQGAIPQLTDVQGLRDAETGRWRRQFSGIIQGQVLLDPRTALYTVLGDWLPQLCVFVVAVLFVRGWKRR